ncbi:protein SFI1 homolog [Engraulis encrasicolus]|uniref:protein SFI1 homolog n=1 Tax=Engraulis encrasicolus TaxID=184585 RepID=UPI002FCFF2E3
MLYPCLGKALGQWRAVTLASRDMRRRAELHTHTHQHTLLRQTFTTWRTAMGEKWRAIEHWERALLVRGVCAWRRCVHQRQRTLAFKERAALFHCTQLLKATFSRWRNQCVWCPPEVEAQLQRKGAWLQRSGVKRRLSWSFRLWAARSRQHRAVNDVYAHTLLSRVFEAWQVYVRCRRQRALEAKTQCERSVCVRAFSRWRESAAQQQRAVLTAAHATHTLAITCLWHWNTHTQQ